MRERSLFKTVAIGSTALWLAVFALVPNLLILAVSMLTRSEADFFTFDFSLGSYLNVFSPLYFDVLADSLKLAAGTVLLCLLAGYPFAHALARLRWKHKGLLLLLVVIPFWTNSLIRTYAMVFILKGKGLLSTALMALGFIDKPLSLLYTQGAVFAGLVYTLLPFMILPIYASIEKLDERFIEAARDLGASKLKTFVNITLPLTMPGVIAGCIMVFLPALGMFYIPDILGGGKSLLLGNFIKNQFLTARDWPTGSAASVMLTLLMFGMLGVYYRLSKGKPDGGLGK